MIEIQPDLLTSIQSPDGLRSALQVAIELEHATIPTYLYTYYSIVQGLAPNADEIASLILEVAMDEMAHFASACNLLNAVSGEPQIYHPGFVPNFPQGLPGSVNPTLQVHLDRFSVDHVRDVFMEIEEPETALEFKRATLIEGGIPATIGEFYGAIRKLILDAGDEIITGDPARQVVIASLNVKPIRTASDAADAIDRIVEEGEGTDVSPLASPGSAELAHYYRFAQIAKEGRLVPNPDATPSSPPVDHFLYETGTLIVPSNCVYPVRRNPKFSQLPGGSPAALQTQEWNKGYTEMLRLLHESFNGKTSSVNTAIDLMTQLGFSAIDLVSIALDDGTNAAPTFEFTV